MAIRASTRRACPPALGERGYASLWAGRHRARQIAVPRNIRSQKACCMTCLPRTQKAPSLMPAPSLTVLVRDVVMTRMQGDCAITRSSCAWYKTFLRPGHFFFSQCGTGNHRAGWLVPCCGHVTSNDLLNKPICSMSRHTVTQLCPKRLKWTGRRRKSPNQIYCHPSATS